MLECSIDETLSNLTEHGLEDLAAVIDDVWRNRHRRGRRADHKQQQSNDSSSSSSDSSSDDNDDNDDSQDKRHSKQKEDKEGDKKHERRHRHSQQEESQEASDGSEDSNKQAEETPLDRDKERMWREQLAINLPMLYLASVSLAKYAEHKGCNRFLFATRDCVHWHRLFKAMFPSAEVHYFHCSRNMFNTARRHKNPYFERYVESVTDGDIKRTIFVDVHGTGKRMIRYFKHRGSAGEHDHDHEHDDDSSSDHAKVPLCFLLSGGSKTHKKLPEACRRLYEQNKLHAFEFGIAGSPIEMLNYDLIGTINDFDRHGPVREKPEYDIELVRPYHDCADAFFAALRRRPHSVKISQDDAQAGIRWFLHKLRKRTRQPIISKWVDFKRTHATDSKGKTQQDKHKHKHKDKKKKEKRKHKKHKKDKKKSKKHHHHKK